MDSKTFNNILAERLDRDVEDITFLTDSLCGLIVESVIEGNNLAIPGFGQFEPKMRSERITTHPSTGKKILVPPKVSMVFKPSALLKQKVK